MNDYGSARSIYQDAAHATRSAKDMEYAVLGRLSHALRKAADQRETNFPAFADAVARNLSFWSIVATDVSSPENRLPSELRQRLFWLSEFVRVESGRALRGTAEVEPLVEINMSLMQGLRPKPDIGT